MTIKLANWWLKQLRENTASLIAICTMLEEILLNEPKDEWLYLFTRKVKILARSFITVGDEQHGFYMQKEGYKFLFDYYYKITTSIYIIEEWCPYCNKDIFLPARLIESPCPTCGTNLYPLNLEARINKKREVN